MNRKSEKSITAQFNQGSTLHQQGKFTQAREIYLNILTHHPDHLETLYLLGAVALQTNQPTEALEWLNRAVAVNPNHPGVHCNRGTALYTLRRHPEALESYDRAIALYPSYAEAYSNRGNVLRELRQYEAAVASYRCAITHKPNDVDTHANQGNILRELKRYAEAVQSYRRVHALQPDYPYLHGSLLYAQAHICNWPQLEEEIKQLGQRITQKKPATYPFPFLALCDSLVLQHQVVAPWVKNEHPTIATLGPIPPHKPAKKIRIGYFSTDFRNHPVAQLTAQMFEQHDRNRFEIIAFSFGPESNDAMRQRLMQAFDQFIDVRNQTDKEIAQLARQMGVDIAVDLNGFTAESRFGIFSYRVAPIQINYLGYPGTVGSDYMDYIIADTTLIPESAQSFYSEKVVYLPHTYMPSDRTKVVSDRIFTREELGLPASGFVFCCFNNNYKITPTTFEGWMRILKQVPDSVLWLAQDNPLAPENLRKEAVRHGVEAHRLVFAQRIPAFADHLARHRMADLFIDSLPYNAHTTANDSLWAGLPVLTCMGESFASRVAGSLLNAIELPELITTSQAAFEARAIELALNPEKLKTIREKLHRNRLTTPLFDSALFTRHLENAYEQIMQRYYAGLSPHHLMIHAESNEKFEKKTGVWGILKYRVSRIFSTSASS